MDAPDTAPPKPKLPEDVGIDYFCQRLDFCRREGIPLTIELLTTHVTGAVLVTASAAREDCEKKDKLLISAGDRLVGLVEIVAHLAHRRREPALSESYYCPL
jgi:hypothetical protein